jgi:hypothetical protein
MAMDTQNFWINPHLLYQCHPSTAHLRNSKLKHPLTMASAAVMLLPTEPESPQHRQQRLSKLPDNYFSRLASQQQL